MLTDRIPTQAFGIGGHPFDQKGPGLAPRRSAGQHQPPGERASVGAHAIHREGACRGQAEARQITRFLVQRVARQRITDQPASGAEKLGQFGSEGPVCTRRYGVFDRQQFQVVESEPYDRVARAERRVTTAAAVSNPSRV